MSIIKELIHYLDNHQIINFSNYISEIKIINELSPFFDFIFKIHLQFGSNYPFHPYRVRFITPIFHPLIEKGSIFCSLLSNNEW